MSASLAEPIGLDAVNPSVASSAEILLSRSERRSLAVRLTLALITAGLLILSTIIWIVAPGQADVAELVAGGAALLVAIPALSAGWYSLRHPDLHGITDQLVALAVIAAWAGGDLTTAALLPMVMTVGHVLEERSLLGSTEAIRALARLTRTNARRRRADGSIEEVPAQVLHVGDRVEVRPGDRIPADGLVRAGFSSVDTAPISGESVPVDVAPGALVFGGGINQQGLIEVEIVRTGEQTALGRVIALMQQAEQAKPPVTRLLERYAGGYMALVLMVVFGAWFATGALTALLAVLVAACPCALVLAAPATSIAAIAVAGRHGILVKGAAFIEDMATANAVVFDKTGTVTLGELRVLETRCEADATLADLSRVAATLGAASSHPVARALAPLAAQSDRIPVEDLREMGGLGIVAHHAGEMLALGRPELFADLGIAASPPPGHDGPIAGVARGDRFLGWILLADEPRPEARQAVADLFALGLTRQVLLTGDRMAVAQRVGGLLNIHDVRAEALPEQKLDCVLAEIAAGYRPMVVGDGINDSLALKAGAVGVAMGAHGTDVALASADLVLLSNDLRRLGTCVRLSRRCRRTIHTNVGLGLGWTVVIIVCAATGMLGASGALIAAVLHNLGTLAVMGNAGRLLKFQES